MKALVKTGALRRSAATALVCFVCIAEGVLPQTALAAELPTPAPVAPLVPNVGAQYSAVPAPLPSVALVGSDGPFIGLTLDDAVGMALSQNTDLALSESSRRIAGYQIVADRGPYDLRFTVAPMFSESTQPALSPFEAGPNGGPTTNLTTGLSSGFNWVTEGGGQFSLQASAQRNASNSTANSYNPYFTTSIALQAMQPLGSGRYTKDRRDLNLAIVSAQSQEASTYITASNTITSVIDAYWDLVAAWRNLGIQEEALAQARAQTSSNDRLVRRGSAAPVDVVESNTQVDVDQDDVFSALQNVASIENRLKSLVIGNPGDPLWQANIVPTSPVAEIPPEPQLGSLIITGLIQRPEFLTVAALRRNADIQLAFARDEAKPQVDLQVNVSEQGFAGLNGNLAQNPIFGALDPFYSTINSLITQANASLPASQAIAPLSALTFSNPASTTGRLGQSWASLFASDYPTVSAQVNIGFPLRNDRARGDLAVARENARQAQIQETQTIQRLIADARNALQQFDAARQRLFSAHAARVAADRVLASEQRKFQVGRSTTFLVLQRQIEAANNQGRELQAQTDLNKSIAELDRVSGAVFIKHGIYPRLPSYRVVDQRFREAGLVPTSLEQTRSIENSHITQPAPESAPAPAGSPNPAAVPEIPAPAPAARGRLPIPRGANSRSIMPQSSVGSKSISQEGEPPAIDPAEAISLTSLASTLLAPVPDTAAPAETLAASAFGPVGAVPH